MAKWCFDSLTEEQAFDLASCDPAVQEKVLPRQIVAKKLNKFEDFEAVLEISCVSDQKNVTDMSKEEHQQWKKEAKEAKQLEKQQKKEAREKRIKQYNEDIARKEKIVRTNPKYPQKVTDQ